MYRSRRRSGRGRDRNQRSRRERRSHRPDVSSNNHDNRATVNWATIKHAGRASFVFIKATEGGGYRNPTFPQILPQPEASA